MTQTETDLTTALRLLFAGRANDEVTAAIIATAPDIWALHWGLAEHGRLVHVVSYDAGGLLSEVTEHADGTDEEFTGTVDDCYYALNKVAGYDWGDESWSVREQAIDNLRESGLLKVREEVTSEGSDG